MTDSVLIAIPCGRSAPDVDHAVSVTDAVVNLIRAGVKVDRRIIHGNCYVHLCRTLLVHEFMKSDYYNHYDRIFFWDDDVACPPGALPRLLSYDRDILVAPYPKKVAPGLPPTKTWPYALTDGIPDPAGLLECDMVATGFLLIKRRVIEAMYEMYADRVFYHEPFNAEVLDLFPTGLIPGMPKNANGKPMWWGEDYAFSVMAKRAGFRIWLDSAIPLIHAGRNVWRGDFTKSADKEEAKAAEAEAA